MIRARLIVNPGAGVDKAAPLLPLINQKLRTIVEWCDECMERLEKRR